MSLDLLESRYRGMPKRGLTEETCKKWKIGVGTFSGKDVAIFHYMDPSGEVVAQKTRDTEKNFVVHGKMKNAGLFGQTMWSTSGRRVVITEGEFDAAALSQCQDHKWPVVSLKNGASGAKTDIGASLSWLEGFEEIILAFDDDEPGREAVRQAAPMFTPGKVRVATFTGFKDANEAVMKGLTRQLLDAVWKASPWRPDGVVTAKDIRHKVLEPVVMGSPWPWEALTKVTFGRSPGDVIALGAGTGVGKTDLFTQMIACDVSAGIKCGVIYLEQGVGETGQRIAGKVAKTPFHIPDGSWDQCDLDRTWGELEAKDLLMFYDSFGSADWKVIKSHIIYMASCGCRHIYLDHLTALASSEDDERRALEKMMAEFAGVAKAHDIVFHFVSHLTTPENGKPHEEGGRVTIRHFKGSRAIGFWSHLMIGMERDQQADEIEDRGVTTLRVLKDRKSGRATGFTLRLTYDHKTGMLMEAGDVTEQVF